MLRLPTERYFYEQCDEVIRKLQRSRRKPPALIREPPLRVKGGMELCKRTPSFLIGLPDTADTERLEE